jgi:hypothetical protein
MQVKGGAIRSVGPPESFLVLTLEEKPMTDVETLLVEAAKRYLKDHYGEDTVSMTVTSNGVEGGNGVLSVDCTVSVRGAKSDWSKEFYFKRGKITTMSARMR